MTPEKEAIVFILKYMLLRNEISDISLGLRLCDDADRGAALREEYFKKVAELPGEREIKGFLSKLDSRLEVYD